MNDSSLNAAKKYPAYPLDKPGLKNDYLFNSTAKADPDGNIEQVRAWLAKSKQIKKQR